MIRTVAAVLALVLAAAATDVAPSAVSELATSGDVDGLTEVTSVNGIPVDMAAILGPAPDDERLAAIGDLFDGEGSFAEPDDQDRLRSVAAEILESSRYQAPTESALDRFLAQAQAWLADAIARLVTALGGARNAGLLALLVVTLAGLAGFAFLARRRTATIERTTRLERILAEGGDPDELERAADLADLEGRHDEAIRHRFVAGLLRLDMAGRITFRPGLTTGTVVEELDDERFTRLARQFEEVAYGGRPADLQMSEASAEAWRSVLAGEAVRG